MPSRTRIFHYNTTPVRVRIHNGEPLWFTRDLAAALSIRFPPGPLLPTSPNSLPGMATDAQVRTVVEQTAGGVPEVFQTWMTDVTAQLHARPATPGPRRANTGPARKGSAVRG